MMFALVKVQPSGVRSIGGSWRSALALFVYAAGFSFAYQRLTTGTGALLLFGSVQATMLTIGIARGERLTAIQILGLLLAYAGLVGLVLPGVTAPPFVNAVLMISAGAAWGVYSLRGKGSGSATAETAGNFIRAVPMAALLFILTAQLNGLDLRQTLYGTAFGAVSLLGIAYAILSGAVTSGIGYAVWYEAIKTLPATIAAGLQLTVPVLAALAGVVLLNEPITHRLIVASLVILGGVALILVQQPRRTTVKQP